jgi:uncharacterized membrane protein
VQSPRLRALSPGGGVLLGYQSDAEPDSRYALVDRGRTSGLMWLLAIFSVAVVVLGRLRGVTALVGLAATLVVVLFFVLPSILDGRSPVLVSTVGAAAISYLALYLTHGFTLRTTTALLGTLGGLACTVFLASTFTDVTALTGTATEEALAISALGVQIDLRGLTLGGMILGALGAIDDMTMTQASAVWELQAANPEMSRRRLARAASRIGSDHVASTVNTLVLAYAGASMPVLIVLVLADQPLGAVVNNEILATEIVRTLVGSIGLVASVPLTTRVAAYVAGRGGSHEARRRDINTEPIEATPIPERRRDVWLRRRRG